MAADADLDHLTEMVCFRFLHCIRATSLQLCLTLFNPVDCSLPGSSVHGILQARMLEWVAVSFPRGFSQYKDWNCLSEDLLHWQAGSSPWTPPGKPTAVLPFFPPFHTVHLKINSFLNWSIVALQCCVSAVKRESALCIMYPCPLGPPSNPPPPPVQPSTSSWSSELSSLHYTTASL